MTNTRAVFWVTILVLAGCGGEEPINKIEQAFKHGPPPGAPPYAYFLTSYKDWTTPACGGKVVDGTWYYATGAWSYGCNAKLQLRANGKCVVVKVVDNGPAAWVESKCKNKCGGTGYIIDASPLVATHLFGTTSAGWSDCFKLEVTPVDKSEPTGPRPCGPSSPPPPPPPPPPSQPPSQPPPEPPGPSAGDFIGDACGDNHNCSSQLCFGAGFPGGMCTQPCERLCPDQPGKAVTFCVTVPWDNKGFCHSRCDWNLHPKTGCRPDYQCINLPRHSEPNVRRNVCVPASTTFSPTAAPASLEGDLPNPESMIQGGCSMAPDVAPEGTSSSGLALLLGLMLWGLRRKS